MRWLTQWHAQASVVFSCTTALQSCVPVTRWVVKIQARDRGSAHSANARHAPAYTHAHILLLHIKWAISHMLQSHYWPPCLSV